MAAPASKPSSKSSGNSAQAIKVLASVFVILLCVGWLGYFLMGNNAPTELPPSTPVARMNLAVVPIFANEQHEFVRLTPSEDGNSMTIGGHVKSQAEFDEVKKALEEAAATVAKDGKPIELKWELQVKK